MAIVKIGFSGLSVPDQVERGRLITGKMDANPDYTTPSPTLAAVNASIDALESAYNASRGHDKNLMEALKLRRKETLLIIRQLAAYVQLTSGGDGEKILGSGFSLRSANTTHADVAGEVHNVRLSDGSNTGKVRVDFDKATDAVIYIIESSLTSDFVSGAVPRGITTKLHKEISGLTPGTTHWIRVYAFGREEVGPITAPVPIIVR